jgi:hypothetical protein
MMNKTTPSGLAVLITVVGILVAGCGDDYEDYKSPPCTCLKKPDEQPTVWLQFTDHEGQLRGFSYEHKHYGVPKFGPGIPSKVYQVTVRDGEKVDYYYSQRLPELTLRGDCEDRHGPFLRIKEINGQEEFVLDHDSVRATPLPLTEIWSEEAKKIEHRWDHWYMFRARCEARHF